MGYGNGRTRRYNISETKAPYYTTRDLRQAEGDFQEEVEALLGLEHIQFFSFAKPGGRPHCPKCGHIVGALAGGVPPGWPDLLVMLERGWANLPIYLHIELKAHGGKLSDDQIRVHAELRGAGANVDVCENIEDVAKVLRCFGHKFRARL